MRRNIPEKVRKNDQKEDWRIMPKIHEKYRTESGRGDEQGDME